MAGFEISGKEIMKIKKLNIEPVETGINLDVDGAPEGIHIEWELVPQVAAILMQLNEERD